MVRVVERLLLGLSAACLCGLMLIVFFDVSGRGLLSLPVRGAVELEEILLAGAIFLGYPVLALREAHITVDLVPAKPLLRTVQRGLSNLLSVALFGLISWQFFVHSGQLAVYGDASPLLSIPSSLVVGALAVLAGLASLFSLAALWRALRDPDGRTSSPTDSLL